jgi:prepilin-type N-terminal cleavage/methylation domain-containing protein
MCKRRLVTSTRFRSKLNSEQGMNLIEVLVAMGILATVGVTFLLGMSTSSKAVVTNQQNIVAEGLAKSQMESIQQQTYDPDNNPPQYTVLAQIPAGYSIQITTARLDPQNDHTGNDEGLQKITIAVSNGGRVVFTLEGYKCNTSP